MELLLLLSVALAVFHRTSWSQPALPVVGMALAIGYGLWRGGAGGLVFGGLAFLVNLAVLVESVWWRRRKGAPGVV